jgi:DNA (cytosine-5)-methyltransferase 1
MKALKSIELFSGAGGLAIGLKNAGWHHELLVERDSRACATMTLNKAKLILPENWHIEPKDIKHLSFKDYRVGMVAGGPPCQPFSLGGKHRGHKDSRDMFPEAVRVVRETKPDVFVFENVKGLLRESFATYFNYIILQLTYPNIVMKQKEEWVDHLSRLERHHTASRDSDLEYRVIPRCLNASSYGVPQSRHRVFIVGFRSTLGKEWSFPNATHSLESLLYSQWVTGQYWDEHKVPKAKRPGIPYRHLKLVDRIRHEHRLLGSPSGERFRTVRDALSGLPDPTDLKSSHNFKNHEFRPGARTYYGHTGSNLDEPAKTLKAGDHGVPGGENMMCLPDGGVRYFTVRESARLQTFPDEYEFAGSWTECMRQIGNAVPVKLAEVVGRSIAGQMA